MCVLTSLDYDRAMSPWCSKGRRHEVRQTEPRLGTGSRRLTAIARVAAMRVSTRRLTDARQESVA